MIETLLDLLTSWALGHPKLALSTLVVLGAVTAANTFRASSSWRDPQRLFDAQQKRIIHDRAGRRCEHKPMLWRRCPRPGTQADHVFPHSKGGPTSIGNGASLCPAHNREKSARVPTRLYIARLEHRRRRYFPAGADVRVTSAGAPAAGAAPAWVPR